MDVFECEEAVRKAFQKERPKKLARAINHFLSDPSEKSGPSQEKSTESVFHKATPGGELSTQMLNLQCCVCREDGVEGRARAFFSAPPPTIVLCVNRLRSSEEVEEALVHELIHTYDYTVRNMDITKGNVLACSEIRSAREAECHEKQLALCRSTKFPAITEMCEWWTKRCVRKTASGATNSMFPDQGATLVDQVFHECYVDKDPFTPSPPRANPSKK